MPLPPSSNTASSSSTTSIQPGEQQQQTPHSFPHPSQAPSTRVATILDFESLQQSAPSSPSSTTTSFRAPQPSSDAGGPVGSAANSTSAHLQNPPGSSRQDIEMDQITPSGHRRRRSTLTARLDHSPSASQPFRSPRSAQSETEAKISEEDRRDELPPKTEASNADDSLSDEDLHDDEETGLTKKDRRRKQAKRRRNTRLDQRIVRDKITDEERKEADQNVVRRLVINASLIGLWYLFSLSISLYNKWMFDSDNLNFAFPLFTTSGHMLVQFLLASLVLYFVPSLRPGNSPHNSDQGRSRHEAEPSERPIMTKLFYLTRIGPCGAATGLDIGLGNTSLKFITLTFYTMCKSSSLAFVLIFAFLFRLETPTWRLVAIIGAMTVGVVMMVAGEVEFELGGFLLVISAAFFSGFRWGLTQILLLRNPATSNPFSSIFFLAPVMFLTLLLIAIPSEGFFELIEGLKVVSEEWGPVRTAAILLFPGSIAFLMTASEFALLKRSSVVTLSIAGIFKEVVTISAAAVIFDDKLTIVNISGLAVTIVAIAGYNWIKLSKMRNEAQMDVYNKTQSYGQGQSSDDHDSSSDEEDTGLLAHDESLVTAEGDILPRVPGSDSDDTRPLHSEHHRQ